jgi:glycosyltransferase involved in cell wall biosynthesis
VQKLLRALPVAGRSEVSDEPLVSVVTPVYNDAPFIEECMRSVLGQTYGNWEHAIADNASTDATPEIAARIAAEDARIRYVRFEEFVPANESYIRALRAMSPASEFCKVLSADDWLFPRCLEEMVAVARSSDTVGLVSAYRLAGDRVDLDGLPYAETVFDGHAILRRSLLEEISVLGSLTALLLRSRIVRETDPFLDGRFEHADTEAACRVLSEHDFGFVHQVLTYTRRLPGTPYDESHRLNTYGPEYLCFLVRYGPTVLAPDEYRHTLRRSLRRYAVWHVKQAPRPSRLREPKFFAYHERALELLAGLGGDDPDIRATVAFLRALLSRRELLPGPLTAPTGRPAQR